MIKYLIICIVSLPLSFISAEEMSYQFNMENITLSIVGQHLDLAHSVERLEKGYSLFDVDCIEGCRRGLKRLFSVAKSDERINSHMYYIERVKTAVEIESASQVEQSESTDQKSKTKNDLVQGDLARYTSCFERVLPSMKTVFESELASGVKKSDQYYIAFDYIEQLRNENNLVCGMFLGQWSDLKINSLMNNYKLYRLLSNNKLDNLLVKQLAKFTYTDEVKSKVYKLSKKQQALYTTFFKYYLNTLSYEVLAVGNVPKLATIIKSFNNKFSRTISSVTVNKLLSLKGIY